MTNDDNLHLVKSELSVLNEHCVRYQSAHSDLCDVLTSDVDIDTDMKRYEDRQVSIIEFRAQVTEWIRKAESRITNDWDSASKCSGSP